MDYFGTISMSRLHYCCCSVRFGISMGGLMCL